MLHESGSPGNPWRTGTRLLAAVGLFLAGIGAGQVLEGREAGANSSLTGSPAFATLEETWNLIHEQWPLPDEIDEQALIYGAAAGMVDALGDQGHSRFMNPEETRAFNDASEGEYTGIGVEIDFRGDRPRIVTPFDGSPADRAGIHSGDMLWSIEGTS
ncbi:MAG: S41 family peptidase, partial [Thermomicrobiales bacterium]